MNFFAIFLGIFLLGPSMNWIRDQFFFWSFSAYLILFWLKKMLDRGFLIFLIFFFYFFCNCLARVEYERNLGLKFFSLFFGQSDSILAKNNAGKWYFIFFEFFFIYFFRNFLPRAEYERNSGQFFFFFCTLFPPISSCFS